MNKLLESLRETAHSGVTTWDTCCRFPDDRDPASGEQASQLLQDLAAKAAATEPTAWDTCCRYPDDATDEAEKPLA